MIARRAALAGLLAGAGTAAWAQAPIVDALGRVVQLARPAERIALGFNFEEFTAIAGPTGWDRVVGYSRTQWAVYHPAVWRRFAAAIPRIAGLADIGTTEDDSFSAERVLSLRPDLVILPQWSFAVLGDAVARFAALGIPVMVIDYNAEIPARHAASTRALAHAVGQAARGEALASQYLAGVADIERRLAGVTRPSAYLELGMEGAAGIGNSYNSGMWGPLLETAGAANIAKGRLPGAWGKLAPEFVLAANPDAIFIAGDSWEGRPNAVRAGYDATPASLRASLATYRTRPGWSGLKAIRNGDIHGIAHTLSRSLMDVFAMQYIAKVLHPDRFADVDPEANLRRYHAEYLPVAFEGSWMLRLG